MNVEAAKDILVLFAKTMAIVVASELVSWQVQRYLDVEGRHKIVMQAYLVRTSVPWDPCFPLGKSSGLVHKQDYQDRLFKLIKAGKVSAPKKEKSALDKILST